jgi:hypothetical protein
MLRSFFLAIGMYAFILGIECLLIEKAVLNPHRDSGAAGFATKMTPAYREIAPADWAPWSLLSVGSVVMLYSFTVPAKMRG